jgi:hypothetical protein
VMDSHQRGRLCGSADGARSGRGGAAQPHRAAPRRTRVRRRAAPFPQKQRCAGPDRGPTSRPRFVRSGSDRLPSETLARPAEAGASRNRSPSSGLAAGSAQCERGGELFACLDVELAVAVGEVHLDGAEGDEEGLRDLLVGVALGGELDDAELGGGERIAAGLCDAAGAGAGEAELVACLVDERGGAAAVGEVGALGENLPGVGALAGPADGTAEVDQGARVLEAGAAV